MVIKAFDFLIGFGISHIVIYLVYISSQILIARGNLSIYCCCQDAPVEFLSGGSALENYKEEQIRNYRQKLLAGKLMLARLKRQNTAVSYSCELDQARTAFSIYLNYN